ncbi:MAG: TolC family protein [Gemmatimonadota bacterium]|nr:TolC family protein [Gemmatimonadota bacterium]MDH4349846.1 TolC family protein [Gemmatimonadota bacterium]MDH5196498.1 TolC family protein [Gemmatimonadota bacterium]
MRALGLAIVLVGSTVGAAAAQRSVMPSVPQSLTLSDAVDLALRYNRSYRQVANDRPAAAWGVRNAYSQLFFPSMSASLSFGYSGAGSQTFLDQEFTQESSTIGSDYGLNLNWRLSGTTLTQPGLARAQMRATEAQIDGAEVNLRANVQQQYLAALQAEAQVRIVEIQVTRNEEFLRLAQARFQVGQATMLDVRQAEVAKGQADVRLLQARQGVIVEKLRLYQQIGLPAPEDPTTLVLPDTFPVTEPEWQLGTLLRAADMDNPDVAVLEARAAAARSSERSAKAQWLPTLSLSAGWSGFTREYSNPDFLVASARGQLDASRTECEYTNSAWLNPGQTPLPCSGLALSPEDEQRIIAGNNVFPFSFTTQPFSARVSLSLPIFTQFGREADISQASQLADDAMEEVENQRLWVRTNVSQAYYGLIAAYQAIGIQEANRVAAQEQLRLATERYRVGSGTFFELLDAQVAEQTAEADYINAIYAYHRTIATLEAAVGRPLR